MSQEERQEMIIPLYMNTKYSMEYLEKLTDKELIEHYEYHQMN